MPLHPACPNCSGPLSYTHNRVLSFFSCNGRCKETFELHSAKDMVKFFTAQEQPVENSPTVNIDCLKCESPLGWNPERGWFHINESSCSGVSGVTDMQRPAFTQKEAK